MSGDPGPHAAEPASIVSPPDGPSPQRGWWPIAWYPVAAPVAYVVAVWSASAIHPGWLLRPLLATLVVVLLVTVVLSRLLADRDWGALAAGTMMLTLLPIDGAARMAVFLAAALIVGVGLWRRGRQWVVGRQITRFMNVLGAALLIVAVVGGIQAGSIQDAIADVQADIAARHAETFNPAAPDIYVILLDGYPGDDAAALDPTFDADAFPDALTQRDFDVQRNARANYLTTRLTVATMLGDQHVADAPELAPPYGNQAADARRLRLFGDDGIVLRTLRDAGYETMTVTSPAAHLGLRRVDRALDPPGPSEFEHVLLKGSAVGPLLDTVAPDLFASIARDQIIATYESAEALAAEPHTRPRFVWIHVMAPHPPFLFHPDGTPITNARVLDITADRSDTAWRSQRIRDTFEYAAYIAARTELMLDRALASATRESVFLVFSDHGTEVGFDAASPLTSDLDERSSIILALRSPGRPGLLPPGTTPIGVLPRVLNEYLGTSLPIRSDTIWGWPWNGSLLDSIPIDPATIAR